MEKHNEKIWPKIIGKVHPSQVLCAGGYDKMKWKGSNSIRWWKNFLCGGSNIVRFCGFTLTSFASFCWISLSLTGIFAMMLRGSSLSRSDSKRARTSSYSVFDASLYAPVRPKRGSKPVLALDWAACNMALYFHKNGSVDALAQAAEAIGFTKWSLFWRADTCQGRHCYFGQSQSFRLFSFRQWHFFSWS